MTSGTSSALVGLAIPDANTAIATGGSGLIRRSTDRGVTWTSQTSGTGTGTTIEDVTDSMGLLGASISTVPGGFVGTTTSVAAGTVGFFIEAVFNIS